MKCFQRALVRGVGAMPLLKIRLKGLDPEVFNLFSCLFLFEEEENSESVKCLNCTQMQLKSLEARRLLNCDCHWRDGVDYIPGKPPHHHLLVVPLIGE